jgi:hypothetical protein
MAVPGLALSALQRLGHSLDSRPGDSASLSPGARSQPWEVPAALLTRKAQDLAEWKAFAPFLLGAGPQHTHSARTKAPHTISLNKETHARRLNFLQTSLTWSFLNTWRWQSWAGGLPVSNLSATS